ncbi:MAG: hypothetical protein ACYC27_02665 [Armatimonadota bacterium]
MKVSIMLLALMVSVFTPVYAKDTLPLVVGGHAHGAKNIQALADLGCGNMIWIPKPNLIQDGNTPWDKENDVFADIDACMKNNMSFLVSQGRGLGMSIRNGGGEYGGDGNGVMWDAKTIRKMKKIGQDKFLGLHAEELDADLLQSGLRPSFRSRYPAMFDYTDRAGGRQTFELELKKIQDLYKSYGSDIKFWPNLCITMHHSGFRTGADVVFAELLEHLPTTELQLAYLRGGSKQFDSDWGVWISPWLSGTIPCEDKKLWPAPYAVIGGGHSASFLRRSLYLSYVAGSRAFVVQNTDCLLSYKNQDRPEDGYKLASWGAELKNFYDYAIKHDQPMRPIIPIAVLVDKDNGWAPGRLWGNWIENDTVWGKLPTDRTDSMLSGYLNVLLPGFGRAKDSWEKKQYYPGYFASTPIGSFDIVSSDVSPQKLSDYSAVIALGDIKMNPDLLNTLKTYVRSGGNLYINADQMRYKEAWGQDREFLGTEIGGHGYSLPDGRPVNMSHVTASSKIVRKMPLKGVHQEEFTEPWYCCVDVQPTTAEIIADTGTDKPAPVLLLNRYGRGQVYLSLPEYMMEGYGDYTKTLGFFESMIRSLSNQGIITVTSPNSDSAQTDISWQASYQAEDSIVVVLANHGDSTKGVDVTCRVPCTGGSIEVGSASVTINKRTHATVFNLTVPAQDIVLLRIRKS